jgi:uroporphyrinogen decarboxylase
MAMLPRERVFKTLDHEEPDRIPWGEHLIDFNVYEAFLGRRSLVNSHYHEQVALWEGRRDEVVAHYKRDLPDLAEALGLDMVTLPGAFPPNDYVPSGPEKIADDTYRAKNGDLLKVSSGNWLLVSERNAANYQPPTVESLDESIAQVAQMPPIDVTNSHWEVHRYIIDKMKSTHFIAALGGGLGFPKFGATPEDEFISLIEHPEICAKLAGLQCRRSIRTIKAYAALGVDAIIPCGDLGTSHGLEASPELYRKLVYPYQKMQAEAAHEAGIKILLHCCGNVMQVIDEIAGIYDAYEAIQTSAGMDLKVLKERVGAKITLWGGIMHEHIIGGTPEQIRADARYSFCHAAPGGGYIYGSSHSLAVGAKIENVVEMKKCRDEWGSYPIDVTCGAGRGKQGSVKG